MSTGRVVVMSSGDSVATVLADLAAGDEIRTAAGAVTATEAIAAGHKIALRDHERGTAVVRYGEEIGRATAPIAVGSHVHVHNVESERLPGHHSTGGARR